VDRAPELDRATSRPRDVLFPCGRAILFERRVEVPNRSVPMGKRLHTEGVYRADVATGRIDRAGFDPRPSPGHGGRLQFGGAPDGQSATLAESWDPVPDKPRKDIVDAWLTLTLSFDGASPRETCTLTASQGGTADAVSIQWSPDGSLAAVDLT
jgi:hypothetical protein